MRRFQYRRIVGDEVAGTLGPAIEDGLRGLRSYCESTG